MGENKLGRLLTQLRRERGLASLNAAARYFHSLGLDVSVETLRKYENGLSPRSGKPIKYSVPMLSRIATGYGLPVDNLLAAVGIGDEQYSFPDIPAKVRMYIESQASTERRRVLLMTETERARLLVRFLLYERVPAAYLAEMLDLTDADLAELLKKGRFEEHTLQRLAEFTRVRQEWFYTGRLDAPNGKPLEMEQIYHWFEVIQEAAARQIDLGQVRDFITSFPRKDRTP